MSIEKVSTLCRVGLHSWYTIRPRIFASIDVGRGARKVIYLTGSRQGCRRCFTERIRPAKAHRRAGIQPVRLEAAHAA